MRIASVDGRPTLLLPSGGLDIITASKGSLGLDVNELLSRLGELAPLTESADPEALVEVRTEQLGPPVPNPRQVFAVGLNYRAHAEEAGRALPESPTVFTKFPACLTGPAATVVLPSAKVDWEVEMVVASGQLAEGASQENGWDHVAGVMIGQDLSERDVQRAGPVPQFSLGKSFKGFGPIGPALVTVDELADRDALDIGCSIDGETVQSGNTRDLLFSVPQLISKISTICPLLPGDLIFTGTPEGVGVTRKPPRFLKPGQILRSWLQDVGSIDTRLHA